MIIIKTQQEIKILSEGGKLLASVLNKIMEKVEPGVITAELDNLACELIGRAGGRPSFLNYKPRGERDAYPAALCVSVNDEVVHGLPSREKILKDGDIVSLDLGLEYKGLFTDMAVTIGVGQINEAAQKLINITKGALEAGISEIKIGTYIGDYGFAVAGFAEKVGFAVVRNLVGHGVGHKPHEDPDIPNYGRKEEGLRFKTGMVLALEPMVCEKNGDVVLDKDGWTWKTKNGLLSAHFEHTVVVEDEGCRVLTNI